MENFTFFYGGELSNWFHSPFIEFDIEYLCVEQYMMANKAIMFEDHITYEKILLSTNPKEQKALGRQVRNFNPTQWDFFKKQIVFQGCWYKFTQDPNLTRLILSTRGEIVECSPVDKIWGIGLGMQDPRRLDKSQWKGQNLLGVVLTEVRDKINKNQSTGSPA